MVYPENEKRNTTNKYWHLAWEQPPCSIRISHHGGGGVFSIVRYYGKRVGNTYRGTVVDIIHRRVSGEFVIPKEAECMCICRQLPLRVPTGFYGVGAIILSFTIIHMSTLLKTRFSKVSPLVFLFRYTPKLNPMRDNQLDFASGFNSSLANITCTREYQLTVTKVDERILVENIGISNQIKAKQGLEHRLKNT